MAKFVPNVLTAGVLRELNIPVEKFNPKFDSMVRTGLDRLGALQRPTGGWGWFDGDPENIFMTACAVHGLSECDRLGFAVDRKALDLGRERLRGMARDEKDLNLLAYAAYALGGDFERLLAPPEPLSPYAQALLVLALHRAGRLEAKDAARVLAASVKEDHWETPKWYYKWDNVSIETTRYAIQALAAVDSANPIIPKAVEWLLAQRKGNHWRSTKDTAVAIAALLQVSRLEAVAAAVGTDGGNEKRPMLFKKVGVSLGGGPAQELVIDLNNPVDSVYEAHFENVAPGDRALAFDKRDEQSDFEFEVEATMRVIEEMATESAPAGINIRVEYDRPLDSLGMGDEVQATVTVTSAEPVDYAMVTSPIPAGAEIIRGSGTGDCARFEERYEKALFFLRSVGPEPCVLRYRMRCAHSGTFTVLPARAELMYNEDTSGMCAGTQAIIAR